MSAIINFLTAYNSAYFQFLSQPQGYLALLSMFAIYAICFKELGKFNLKVWKIYLASIISIAAYLLYNTAALM